MKYAVILTGGQQHQVTVGEILQIERLAATGPVVFDQVLLVVDGDLVEIGTPMLEGMKVYATVIKEFKGEKIEVFKYKSKSRYRKHTGHRQKYTQVKIESIGSEPTKVVAPKAEIKPTKVTKPKVAKAVKTAKPVAAKKPAAKKPAVKKTPAK